MNGMQRTRHAAEDASPLIPGTGCGLRGGDDASPLIPGIGWGFA